MKKIYHFIIALAVLACLPIGCAGSSSSDETVPPAVDTGMAVQPSAAYLSRKAQYVQYCSDNSGPGSGRFYGQVCRAYTGAGSYDETKIAELLAKLDSRADTSDFQMNAILRILYLDRKNPTLPPALRDQMKTTVLNFKYWLDEPGPDNMCWWSENHQGLFHTAELLAGLLYPDDVFPNSGMTGRQHAEHARALVTEWINYRGRFGFSEFHSTVYFNEDIPSLTNLADYADTVELRTKAAIMLDIIAFDFACNFYKSRYATAHGRVYPERYVKGYVNGIPGPPDIAELSDSITEAAWLMLGIVDITAITDLGYDNFGAAFLATSDTYYTPAILENIATDSKNNIEHKQRDSITLDEGPALYGIGYSDWNDIMFWWGATAYLAPQIIDGTFKMIDHFNMWGGYLWNKVETLLKPYVGSQLLVALATDLGPMSRGSVLEAASTYTYRTPYYQLSGVQDWKPFQWTGQVSPWQATLDKDCFVFTHFTGSYVLLDQLGLVDDWVGGFMPRGTMYKNVGIFQYHMPVIGDLANYDFGPIDWNSLLPNYIQLFFPKNNFDNYFLAGQWTFGQKGDAYLAVYSETTPEQSTTHEYELIAYNRDNVFIVEMSDAEHYPDPNDFVNAILAATVEIGAVIHYDSPSQGAIDVGWTGPMTVNGTPVDLGPYNRWDNKYSYQEFGTLITPIVFGNQMLLLDFSTPRRVMYNLY